MASESPYQFEYMKIHDQRALLNQYITSYLVSGILYSSTIMALTIALGKAYDVVWWLYIIGAVVSIGSLLFVLWLIDKYDKSIFQLYPRIIALELLLNYHFYRNYLITQGGEYEIFVKDCEKLARGDSDKLWADVLDRAHPARFPYTRGRGSVRQRIMWIWFIMITYGAAFWIAKLISPKLISP